MVSGIANIAKRERNRGAKQLDAFMKVSSLHPSLCYGLNSETLIVFTKSEIVFLWKELALPLKGYMESFPRKKLLHPYERSLIDLTLGDGKYEEVSIFK